MSHDYEPVNFPKEALRNLRVQRYTEEGWLRRVPKGNMVWCVKEQLMAIVDHTWAFGLISLREIIDYKLQAPELAQVDENGCDADQAQRLLPIKGELPEITEAEEKLPPDELRIRLLEDRVRRLEHIVDRLSNPRPGDVFSIPSPYPLQKKKPKKK